MMWASKSETCFTLNTSGIQLTTGGASTGVDAACPMLSYLKKQVFNMGSQKNKKEKVQSWSQCVFVCPCWCLVVWIDEEREYFTPTQRGADLKTERLGSRKST